MGDEISPQEKLKIAQHFLLNSPPAQFGAILKDVKALLPNGLLTDPLAGAVAKAYNARTSKVVVTPSGHKAVLSASSEVEGTKYVDPKTQQLFTVDHLTLATSPAAGTDTSSDRNLESKRSALQTALDTYIGSFYKAEDSAAGAYARNGTILIVISSEKPNLRSYWAGRWTSAWSIKWGTTVEVTGEIKVQAHYFEDGNIQLHTNRPITQTATISASGSEGDVAKAIVKHIEGIETTTRAGLDEMYGTLNTDTLKAMRRTLPITKVKMEWNVNAVRMNKQTRAAANNTK